MSKLEVTGHFPSPRSHLPHVLKLGFSVIRLAFRVAVETVIYARPYRLRKGSVAEWLACWTQAQ